MFATGTSLGILMCVVLRPATSTSLQTNNNDKSKLKGSDTSRMRIWVTPRAKPPRPTKMLAEVKRSLDRAEEGRDEEYPLLPWDQWQQQAL